MAFEILKSRLGRAERLAYFDRNAEETKLITDASPAFLRAVLTQVQKRQERVVAYASRCLTEFKRIVGTRKQEARRGGFCGVARDSTCTYTGWN